MALASSRTASAWALGGSALYLAPMVVADTTPHMLCMREETFGPFASIARFQDEAQALECGVVGINTAGSPQERASFEGVKQSGLGRESSQHGIED